MKMSKQLLTFLFMLAVSGSTLWAQRAGVNTTTPEATLDIQANPTSVTANEANGILIPRLTGDEIKAMTGMQASTLIYATAAATTPELTAEYITEPGYYYYNSTDMVWVRVQTNANDRDEWFTRNDTTFLRRSDEGQIPNRVHFDKNGYYTNTTTDSYDVWDGTNVVTRAVGGNTLVREASKIADSPTSGNKSLGSEVLVLDNSDTSTGTDNDRNGSAFSIVQNRGGNANYKRVRASSSSANIYGGGTMQYIIGSNNGVHARDGSTINNTGYSIAGRNESYWNSTGTSNAVIGVQGRATIGTLAGNVTRVTSVEGINTYLQNQSNEIEWSYAGDFRHEFNSGSYNVKNLIGVNIGSITSSNGNAENSYGLYVGDVTKGTNSRYSIYTNQGKSSLGDTLQVRNLNTTTSTDDTDKVVVADADGVLKTKSAAAVSAASEPWYKVGTTTGATENTDDIFTNGNVGVGTETVTSFFQVNAGDLTDANDDFYVHSNPGTGQTQVGVGTNNLNDFTSLTLANRQETRAAYGHLYFTESDAATPGTFSILERNLGATHLGGNDGTTSKIAITYKDSGEVGIGNMDPVADLDIFSLDDDKPALQVDKNDNDSPTVRIRNGGADGKGLLVVTGNSSSGTNSYIIKGEHLDGTEKFVVHSNGKIKASNVIFTGIPTHADDAAAGAAGLVAGEMYKTATGELRIKL